MNHTTPTRIVAKTPDAVGGMKGWTWYRNGRQMGGYGNRILRVATMQEIAEWETARAEERRVRDAEKQKRKAEEEALRLLVPEGIEVLITVAASTCSPA